MSFSDIRIRNWYLSDILIGFASVIAIIIGIIIVIAALAIPFTTQDTVILTVTDKAAIPIHHTSCDSKNRCDSYTTIRYMIYTNGETLQLEDAIVLWSIGASEKYGKIHIGNTYEFKVYGYRNQLWGIYRNIIDIQRQVI